jgi:UDPglucose 6-dehydrogenase
MIGFAGLSHLGIVSSIAAAAKGFDVLGYDADAALCAALAGGRFPIFEPGLEDAYAACRQRIRFTADLRELRECDVTYLSLDVPTGPDNRSDVGVLDQRLSELTGNSAPGTTLVLLSQAPPGFSRRWAAKVSGTFSAAGNGAILPGRRRAAEKVPDTFAADLALFYQVETLVFGRALERALQPERLIVGCQDPGAELPAAYGELLAAFGCPIFRMRYESAELAKIAVNLFLASSVSVTNTLAGLCERLGGDWSEIVPTLRLDPRIGAHAYLSPGLGLSGGNLERDLATVRDLATEHGAEAGVIDAWLVNSRHRRDWVLRLLHSHVLAHCPDPTIAIWGLAYKPDTAATKNAPAIALIEALDAVSIRAYDPQVSWPAAEQPGNFVACASALEACTGADALAILTPWQKFRSLSPAYIREMMRGRTVIDPFAALDGACCRRVGLDYFRLGEPAAKEILF